MRIRTIKPEFFTHEALFEAEAATGLPLRLAFIGLWCACDREGRFKWQPRRLGVQIMPYDGIDFSRVLDALATRGFVVKYRVGDDCFGWVKGFKTHQVINNRELDSIIPSHDSEDAVVETLNGRVPDACRTRDQRVDHAGQGEGKGRERKGTIADDEHPREQSAPADKQQRERNPIWDTVCDVCGVDSGALTKTISTLIGRAVKEIKEASPDVTPDMIRRKAAAYRKQYPDCALTVSALMKHWSTLLVVTVNPVAASKPIPTLDEQAAPFKGKTMADLIQQVEMEMGTVATTEEVL